MASGVMRLPASKIARSFFLVVAMLVVSGCKDPDAAGSTGPSSGFVRAGNDVVIKDVRTYTPVDQIAGTNDVYYVVTFAFTNNQAPSFVPKIDHFVIEDEQRRRFNGADSGSPTLIGISNYPGVLALGEAHDYTVGFRVPVNTRGLLFYDNSY